MKSNNMTSNFSYKVSFSHKLSEFKKLVLQSITLDNVENEDIQEQTVWSYNKLQPELTSSEVETIKTAWSDSFINNNPEPVKMVLDRVQDSYDTKTRSW